MTRIDRTVPTVARHTLRCAMLSMAFVLPTAAVAQAPVAAPQPSTTAGVISLNTSATVEVAMDVLNVVFSTTKEGTDANAVQTALKTALDAALTEARKIARPGQVDVQTGNFSLFPRYTSKGGITGWQGSSQLVVHGKDVAAIAALTGRVQSMVVSRVGYELSRDVREKTEADVTAQAIARYRAKASELSKHFGYASYAIREVNVTTNEPSSGAVPMMRARVSESASSYDALPTEAGKANVTATVGGSVQMLK